MLPLRRQFGVERFRTALFCVEGVYDILLHPSPVVVAAVLPLLSVPLCVMLLARISSAQFSMALLLIHLVLILSVSSCSQ